MAGRRRWIWIGVFVLAAAAAAAWYATRPKIPVVRTAPVVTVYPAQQLAVLTAPGRIVARRKVTISSKVPGRLAWLGVTAGARVKAGEVIARLESRGADAPDPRVVVDDTLVRAPFDGVIIAQGASVGDMVTPFASTAGGKASIVSMADSATLEVEADIAASDRAAVRVAQPCEIALDALPDARFLGSVAEVVPATDRTSALVRVRFDTADPAVMPGVRVKLSLLSRPMTADEARPRLAVPPEALVEREGRSVVYLIRGGRVEPIAVTPERKFGALTAIAGEIKSGERAVLDPSPTLAAGVPVEPARDLNY